MDINKIIAIVRNLQEDGAAIVGPTNNTGSGPSGAGYGGTAQGFTPKNAGIDLPIGKLDGRSKIARRLPPPYKKSLINSKKKR